MSTPRAERNRAAPDLRARLKDRSEIRGGVGTPSPGVDGKGPGLSGAGRVGDETAFAPLQCPSLDTLFHGLYRAELCPQT